jgi:hypothetical protein
MERTPPTQQELMDARSRVNKARLELKRAEDALRTLSPNDFVQHTTAELQQLIARERACQTDRHNLQQRFYAEYRRSTELARMQRPVNTVCKCDICERTYAHTIHSHYRPFQQHD